MNCFKLHQPPLDSEHHPLEIKRGRKLRKSIKNVLCFASLLLFTTILLNVIYDKYISNEQLDIRYSVFRTLPLRTYSRIQGYACKIYVPWPLNIPVLGVVQKVLRISLKDAERESIGEYTSVNDLFTRKIKKSSRAIGEGIVSPADGTIIYAGHAADSIKCQIKGVNYKIEELLLNNGVLSNVKKENDLFQVVIYLAPYDYHRFHSFYDFTLTSVIHVSSLLFSVGNLPMKYFPGLLSKNERVIFSGFYEHGQCHTIAVGSVGVGSISTSVAKFRTNKVLYMRSRPVEVFKQYYEYAKGDELGHFNLGSTIVCVFEAPKDFTLHKTKGAVKMGETLGTWKPVKTSNPA
ncbi:phosphatidylserine decarboxylase [Nematocida minor]|uniref:phosphatidylserine decarboxylase n=1 Tax=Nematocida minor TaxID=1912983 RepID=UPI002220B90F|nr:phosphatidylserine decarboxylase [Nematocida minor]KAI5191085.1 phosphatidylserine decarboxylase [Nematocida minor]